MWQKIDYIISNYNIYRLVEYVRVSPLHLSDHCLVEARILELVSLVEACIQLKYNAVLSTKPKQKLNHLYDTFSAEHNQSDEYSLAVLEEESRNTLVHNLLEQVEKFLKRKGGEGGLQIKLHDLNITRSGSTENVH